ncbi:hypothetical protein DFP72DRAFT_841526 [Ephemerocybe angulata]|uniref:Uncharacterized protein n=1 Tax=Ephemerocybe angulata TaxID=980116 RepID=A0A8H6MBU1_9AGAR|nr:hypothetical protein DFP72DRAFT_841526 [Tulosesus angulatus]
MPSPSDTRHARPRNSPMKSTRRSFEWGQRAGRRFHSAVAECNCGRFAISGVGWAVLGDMEMSLGSGWVRWYVLPFAVAISAISLACSVPPPRRPGSHGFTNTEQDIVCRSGVLIRYACSNLNYRVVRHGHLTSCWNETDGRRPMAANCSPTNNTCPSARRPSTVLDDVELILLGGKRRWPAGAGWNLDASRVEEVSIQQLGRSQRSLRRRRSVALRTSGHGVQVVRRRIGWLLVKVLHSPSTTAFGRLEFRAFEGS